MNEKTLTELIIDEDYEEITNRFSKYLGRYRDIFNPRVTTGKVIRLAKTSTDIYRTLRYLTHKGTASEVHQMRTSIMDMFGEEELSQTVYLAFYETLSRFNLDKEVPLEKFIYNYYPYMITAEIIKLAGPKQLLNDITVIIPEEIAKNDSATYDDILPSDMYFDYKWIEGECEEPFKCLTPLERKLLVMIYCDKRTHEEIALEMRYHFSSIKRKKNDIIEKLKKRVEELNKDE